jgi:asparagine synthase (glutamine-hydrolysing)
VTTVELENDYSRLVKQDQMSMAASIESRVPFLDHKLVEYTAKMPERLKWLGAATKYVLRKRMKRISPEPILWRSKAGFPVPILAWFRGSYRSIVDKYVTGERALPRGVFNADFGRSVVRRHQVDGEVYSERLWAFVNLEIWQRQYCEGEHTAPSEDPHLQSRHVG